MYHEMTPYIVFIRNKERVHDIFLKSRLQIKYLKTSISILGFTEYCFTSSAFPIFSSTKFMSVFGSFLNTKCFQCFALQ